MGNVLPPPRVTGCVEWCCLGLWCFWGCLGAGGCCDRRQASRPQRHSAANGAPERAISDGSRARATRRSAPRTSSSGGSGGGRKKNKNEGSLPAPGKSAFVKAVVGKGLPQFIDSIPSLHTKGVRQRLGARTHTSAQ